jgi:hypothetical protein
MADAAAAAGALQCRSQRQPIGCNQASSARTWHQVLNPTHEYTGERSSCGQGCILKPYQHGQSELASMIMSGTSQVTYGLGDGGRGLGLGLGDGGGGALGLG